MAGARAPCQHRIMPTDSTTENPSAPSDTPPPPAAPPAGPPRDNRFFAWTRSLDLPRQPGWIGGVCAGIAARIGIDPIIVRGIAVVIAVLGGPLLFAYAAAWMLLPDHTGKIHAEELGRGRFEAPVAGAGLLVLLSLLPSGHGWFFDDPEFGGLSRAVWTLAIIAAAIWFVVWIVRRSGRGGTRKADAAPAGYSMPGAAPYPAPAASAPGTPPGSAPPTDATGLADWTAQQARFKQERDEFVRSETEAGRAAWAAQAEEQRRIREERTAAHREARRRTRSNPLYTLVAIGLALVVGALVTLVVSDYAFTSAGLIAGLAAALAVLGTAIVINGIRGKRSGGSSGLAVVIAIVLITVGALAQFSNLSVSVDTNQLIITTEGDR